MLGHSIAPIELLLLMEHRVGYHLVYVLLRGEEGDELLPRRQALLDVFILGILLSPAAQSRELVLAHQAHPGHLLERIDPVSRPAGGDVEVANGFAAEEPFPLELPFQQRQVLLHLLHEPLLLLRRRLYDPL